MEDYWGGKEGENGTAGSNGAVAVAGSGDADADGDGDVEMGIE